MNWTTINILIAFGAGLLMGGTVGFAVACLLSVDVWRNLD